MNQVNPIVLTPKAVEKVREFTAESEGLIRMGARGGGCSGFQAFVALDHPHPTDILFSQEGIELALDQASLDYMVGSTLDYVDGLMGAGFSFSNPNAVGQCGCGSSFRIREDSDCGSAV